MTNRHDPRLPRSPSHDADRRDTASHDRHEHDRSYERRQDMGGSAWSGASGRGGMSYDHDQARTSRESGHPHEGGYSRQAGYPREGGYPRESDHALSYGDYARREGADNEGGFQRESGFPVERGFGHVPGQRWSGGYGGDVVRGRGPRERESMGSGFAGSDFGPPSAESGRGAHRHFGNEVDRGGRMYGASDMGMGAPVVEDRGPHYGKGPKGYKRSDARIREDVCEEIAHQGFIDASDLEVTVQGGAVTLSGTVARRQEKRALEHLIERCRGVEEVHNHIRLKREDASGASASTEATKDASATLQAAPNGKGARA